MTESTVEPMYQVGEHVLIRQQKSPFEPILKQSKTRLAEVRIVRKVKAREEGLASRLPMYRVKPLGKQQGQEEDLEWWEWVQEDSILKYGEHVPEGDEKDEDGDDEEEDEEDLKDKAFADAERRIQEKMEAEEEERKKFLKWYNGRVKRGKRRRSDEFESVDVMEGYDSGESLLPTMSLPWSDAWKALLAKDYKEHVLDTLPQEQHLSMKSISVDSLLDQFMEHQKQILSDGDSKAASDYLRCEMVMRALRTCFDATCQTFLLYEQERGRWGPPKEMLAELKMTTNKKTTSRRTSRGGRSKKQQPKASTFTTVNYFARFLSLLPAVVHAVGKHWEEETVATVSRWTREFMQWSESQGLIAEPSGEEKEQ